MKIGSPRANNAALAELYATERGGYFNWIILITELYFPA